MTSIAAVLTISLALSLCAAQTPEPSDRVTACEDTKYGKICVEAIVEEGKEGFRLIGTFKDKKIFSTHVSTADPAPINVPLGDLLKLKLYIYDIQLNFAAKQGSFKTRGEIFVTLYKKPVGKFYIGKFTIENGKIKFNGKDRST
uniref:Secreted protein n=1 Tax=Steinernema glaseri TaxID=37863 RepID=A0A1I7Y8X8_9BILA